MEFGRKLTKEELPKWELFYQLGMKNGWMNGSYAHADGDFIVEADRLNKNSGFAIDKVGELKKFFKHGNWCLGDSVIFKDFCFMQQVNGGDEWMVCKYDKDTNSAFSFESWSCGRMIEDKTFSKELRAIQKATNENLRHLKY